MTKPVMQLRNLTARKCERGAALLVFVLISVLGVSALFLSAFNARVAGGQIENVVETRRALQLAREALLGGSVALVDSANLNVRPGQLPWPDRATDGNYDGRSDCTAINALNLLGRFPYLGAGTCNGMFNTVSLDTYFEDGHGEPLWYAVSRNLVFFDTTETPAITPPGDQLNGVYLKVNPALVDAPVYPWLRVCDADGNLLADNVAAVIIAPGPALATQSRVGATPAANQFLDSLTIAGEKISNADSNEARDTVAVCAGGTGAGEDFVAPVGLTEAQRGLFNDELVFITAEELLSAVQRRAMNAVNHALESHVQAFGRLPWLSPFADATAGAPLLTGNVTVAGTTVFTGDAAADYDALMGAGGLVGAAIRNTTTGATAQIVSVSANQITTTALIGGSSPQWSINDGYEIPTFRGDPGTRFGHLPFHDPEIPEDRRADFTVDWALEAARVAAVNVTATANGRPTYSTVLQSFALSSDLSGGVTVGSGADDPPAGLYSGVCRQDASGLNIGEGHVRCQGRALTRQGYLSMTAAATSATALTGQDFVAVSGAVAFDAWGIEPGDLVTNTTDGSTGIVAAVTAGSPNLVVTELRGGATNQFTAGDQVTTRPAALTQDFAGAESGSNTQLTDTDVADFAALGVQVDDVVVNQDDGSFAFITALAGDTLMLSGLLGGTDNVVQAGDRYQIRSGFVNERRITFDLLFTGARTAGPITTQNVYSVESNSDLISPTDELIVRPTPDAAVGEDQLAAAIQIEDFDEAGNRVAEVIVQLDTASEGYVRVGNIEEDFYLSRDNGVPAPQLTPDVPRWIFEQGWHEYIAVGIANQWLPDGTGTCVNVGDCLTVTSYDPRSNQVQDAQVAAVVLGASEHVGGAAPARPSADITAYFENFNVDADLNTFESSAYNPTVAATGINDRLTITCTNAIALSACQ